MELVGSGGGRGRTVCTTGTLYTGTAADPDTTHRVSIVNTDSGLYLALAIVTTDRTHFHMGTNNYGHRAPT